MDKFTRLNSQLENTELDDPYDYPEVWFSNILQTKASLASIKLTYGKDDMQIISHVLSKVPHDLYKLFISNYEINVFTQVSLTTI